MATMKHLLEAKGFSFFFLPPEARVQEALKVLTERRVGAVLVMDGERLLGIVSERDLVHLAARSGGLTPDLPVSDVMTTGLFVVKLDTTVDECMALMTDKRFRHAPVVDGNLVVGIVSIGDVVKELVGERESVIRGLENYIAVREFPT